MPADPAPPIESGPNFATGTASGTSTVRGVALSLEKEAERERVSVQDQVLQQDADLRRWTATRIVWTFIGGNVVTLGALAALVWLDEANVRNHVITADQRIITEHVIMTLLGATTVQVGTIAAIIARYLFPARARDG